MSERFEQLELFDTCKYDDYSEKSCLINTNANLPIRQSNYFHVLDERIEKLFNACNTSWEAQKLQAFIDSTKPKNKYPSSATYGQ